MDVVGALFSILWIVFIFTLIRKILKSAKENNPQTFTQGRPQFSQGPSQFTKPVSGAPQPIKTVITEPITIQREFAPKAASFNEYNSKKTYIGMLSLKDDRENDWFAKQLREEHQAFKRTSDMFNLKIEHASSCDARMLADFHASHHDADSVDRGEV